MWKGFFLRLLQSCNPLVYGELVPEKSRSSYKHFFVQFLGLFVVMVLLFIPAYLLGAGSFSESLGSFSEASVDASFETNESLVLLERPRVVFDMNASSSEDAQLVIGAEGFYYKPYYLFGDGVLEYSSAQRVDSLDPRLFWLFGLFVLPSILFWAGVFFLVKSLVLSILFAALGWVVAGSFKQSITFSRAVQVSLYALVPALFFEMLLFPFWNASWLGLLVYVVVFSLGVALLSERKVGRSRPKKK